MATTSSSHKRAVSSRSVSMPFTQASTNSPTNGNSIENQTPNKSIAPPHSSGGAQRHSRAVSSSHHAHDKSFSARAKNTPQIAQDIDALNQPIHPGGSYQHANATHPSSHPYYHAESLSSSTQNTSRDVHPPPAHTGSRSQSQSSIQVSPAAQSSTRRSPRDAQPQRQQSKTTRSPLTNLQTTLQDISKEEKRAKVEEAERLLRETQTRLQGQNRSRNALSSSTVEGTGRAERNVEPSGFDGHRRPSGASAKQPDRSQETRPPKQTRLFSGEHDGFYPQNRGHDHEVDRSHRGDLSGNQQSLMSSALPKQLSSSGYDDLENLPVDEPNTSSREFNNASSRNPNAYPESGAFTPKRGSAIPVPVGRSNSQKLQKRRPTDPNGQPPAVQGSQHRSPRNASYQTSPQDYTAHQAPQDQGFDPTDNQGLADSRQVDSVGLGLSHVDDEFQPDTSRSPTQKEGGKGKHKQATVSFDVPPPTPPPLSEWKNATVCKLRATDFDLRDSHVDKAWWETGGSRRRRRSQKIDKEDILPRRKLGKNVACQPALDLECGPLLRFTGMRHENIDSHSGPIEQDIWRGSIMIVTKDSTSSYETPPTLRLFSQPMNLLPPPPPVIQTENGELAPEYVDPIAGVAKMGRDGKLLFVKPVDHIEEGQDLSFFENEDGLFEESPSPLDYKSSNQVSKPPEARIKGEDGESVGKYKEVEGIRLYADPARDVTFWRFSLEIELGDRQQRIAYRINHGSAIGFWVPAKGQSMNMMYYSGNGFGISVDTDKYSGPDPMWRDVLNTHQTRPFHVMIGGGGQINAESVSFDTTHFRDWLDLKVKYEQQQHPFNLDLKAELETFYLELYLAWFSQGLYSMASSQIPMVNMWDGRDIMQGFGSYSDEFMASPVFSGLGNIAFKYYLLFQHQTVPEETQLDEPSWLLGIEPSPYIHQRSRSLFMNLGERVSLLAVDCRTERTRDYVLSDDTYDHIWDRCYREINKGETKHLLVLLAEPVASPRLAWIQNVLSSKAMGPVRALGSRGLFGGAGDNLEDSLGNPDDQWTAKIHKEERRWLIEDLQELAAEKSVRITVLGGGAHLAAVGQFYSDPKLQLAKDEDYRYMPNIISSGIVNAPISEMMSGALNRRSKTHVFDANTIEDMRSIFTHGVDGKPRSNKRLLARRNWCSIREYVPGATPPQTPSDTSLQSSPPTRRGSLMRTLSMSRSDRSAGKLVRRSSQNGPPPSRWPSKGGAERRMSHDGLPRPNTQNDPLPARASTGAEDSAPADRQNAPSPQPGNFVRRRTDLNARDLKSAAKGGPDLHHFINLRHGLDIALNCEVSSKDPAGISTPYRILVPALSFDGDFEPSVAREKKRWWKIGGKKNETDHHSPTAPKNPDEEEYLEEPQSGFANRHGRKAGSPPPLVQDEEFPSTESVPARGYDGIEAYQPRKKFLGIF